MPDRVVMTQRESSGSRYTRYRWRVGSGNDCTNSFRYAAVEPCTQRLPFEQFSDDVRERGRADVEHGQDVRMGERRGRARLLLEALEAIARWRR